MIELLKYHARCNREINAAMLDVIEKSERRPYDLPREGYYKSIHEILDHAFIADTVWLKAFRQVRDSRIFDSPLLTVDRKWGERQFDDLAKYREARRELDGLIVEYVSGLQAADLDKTITRTTRTGDKVEKLLWKSVAHMFNHDTHHRGQVAEILDELGVANDYSNMIRYD